MPSAFETLKRQSFWVVSNMCRNLYGAFPVFGTLRAALGVVHRDGRFLVICRNDVHGVSLPGGISNWRETEEQTIDREICEETGLTVSGKKFLLRFHSEVEFPCNISLFEAQVSGDSLKNSWEGSPQWMTIAEIQSQLVESQLPVLAVFSGIAGGGKTLITLVSAAENSGANG